MSKFVHLHVHSHYSLLDGVAQVKPLVKKAKALGYDALALTDNGNLYGTVEFYEVCKKEGVKPIIGLDAYLAPRTRFDQDPAQDSKRMRLVLLAETTEGYKNLIKLVTASYTEGFFYKPRIDHELLERWHDGLIAILPSLAGERA